MDIESLKLRKCKIIELDSNLSYFRVEDLIDNSSKEIFLTGHQRLNYKIYAINDMIYAAITPSGNWRLVENFEFKRSKKLRDLKSELQKYLDSQLS